MWEYHTETNSQLDVRTSGRRENTVSSPKNTTSPPKKVVGSEMCHDFWWSRRCLTTAKQQQGKSAEQEKGGLVNSIASRTTASKPKKKNTQLIPKRVLKVQTTVRTYVRTYINRPKKDVLETNECHEGSSECSILLVGFFFLQERSDWLTKDHPINIVCRYIPRGESSESK